MTRPVSSETIFSASCDEANAGRDVISRMRARSSSSVCGAGAVWRAAGVGEGCGAGAVSLSSGVSLGGGVGTVTGGGGVCFGWGVGVGVGRCVVTRRSRC